MKCIKSVLYSFLREGDVFGEVTTQRRVRQGDPILPYLYIICAEGLSGMILLNENMGYYMGAKLQIMHKYLSSSFRDRLLLFLKVTKLEERTLKSVLHRYEALSGQVIKL